MRIKFWGVRGSTPTPQSQNLRYGGNTPCLEFRSDAGNLLIVDCGSGLRMLGKSLSEEFAGQPIDAHILLSHYHWDHIQGLPFFAPLYQPENSFHFHSFHLGGATVEQALQGQMMDPYFPVDMGAMKALREFSEVGSEAFSIHDFTVTASRVKHPQGCLAFRIENAGDAVVYATDNEPGDPMCDRNLCDLCRSADILIYDAQYSEPQLHGEKRGWGHSCWAEGIRICQEAEVQQLVLFHHDPDNDDRLIDRLAEEARAEFQNSVAAFEGMEMVL
jgi:phosphoribosyl 1,2-cyclic phosphodiesterase